MNFLLKVQEKTKYIAGISVDLNAIQNAWEQLHQQVQTLPNMVANFPQGESFGVCVSTDDTPEANASSYLAAVPVTDLNDLPAPFSGFVIPEGKYAVFNCADIESIGPTYRYIYENWLPSSGLNKRMSFDFERYHLENGVETIEIWVPV